MNKTNKEKKQKETINIKYDFTKFSQKNPCSLLWGMATCTDLIGYAYFSPPITWLQIASSSAAGGSMLKKKNRTGEILVGLSGHVKGATILKRATRHSERIDLNGN